MELPLLKVIDEAGGSLPLTEAVAKIEEHYPGLTEDEKASRLKSGGNRWVNRVQWVRQKLLWKGELDGSVHGVWRITEKGKARLADEWPSWKVESSSHLMTADVEHQPRLQSVAVEQGLSDPYEALESTFEDIHGIVTRELLGRIKQLLPALFEALVARLLERLGYNSPRVIGRPGDGGVDGECCLDALGLYKVLFQAKRWKDRVVGEEEVRNFIGALHAERVDRGVFITTSTFTKPAGDKARQSGNIRLIDGDELAKLMIDCGLGVRKTSLDIPRIDEDYFEGRI